MDAKDEVSTTHAEKVEHSTISQYQAGNGSDIPQPQATTVHIGWRSWVVVAVTTFVIMAQVFVVTAAGSVIAFIVRDLGDAGISGWIIQV